MTRRRRYRAQEDIDARRVPICGVLRCESLSARLEGPGFGEG